MCLILPWRDRFFNPPLLFHWTLILLPWIFTLQLFFLNHFKKSSELEAVVYGQSLGNALFAKCVIRSIIFKCVLEICYATEIQYFCSGKKEWNIHFTYSHFTTEAWRRNAFEMDVGFQLLQPHVYVDFASVPRKLALGTTLCCVHLNFVFQRQQILQTASLN